MLPVFTIFGPRLRHMLRTTSIVCVPFGNVSLRKSITNIVLNRRYTALLYVFDQFETENARDSRFTVKY